MDLAGGLYDFRARTWSPELGAFLELDGFGYLTNTGTLWSWPGQNPFRWRDPSGREPMDDAVRAVWVTAGGGILGGVGLVVGGGGAAVSAVLTGGATIPAVPGAAIILGGAGAVAGGAAGGALYDYLFSEAPEEDGDGGSCPVREAAAELAERAGRNRVSGTTAGGRQIDIDLQGDSHFEKKVGLDIPTPHVRDSKINVGPSGKSSLSEKTVRPATMDDIRTARKIFERE